MNFDKKRTLKILTIFIVFYSITQVLILIIPFFRSYFSLGNNPLLPEYLIYYIAFPLYFLLPLFVLITFYSLSSLLKNEYNEKAIISLLALITLYFIFQGHIYTFIQKFNPYGT